MGFALRAARENHEKLPLDAYSSRVPGGGTGFKIAMSIANKKTHQGKMKTATAAKAIAEVRVTHRHGRGAPQYSNTQTRSMQPSHRQPRASRSGI